MKHKVGDKVVFIGRAGEQDKYHPEYQQLMGSIGIVTEVDEPTCYIVGFEGFEDANGDNDYVCYENEVVAE